MPCHSPQHFHENATSEQGRQGRHKRQALCAPNKRGLQGRPSMNANISAQPNQAATWCAVSTTPPRRISSSSK
jgi:hypothetical protein